MHESTLLFYFFLFFRCPWCNGYRHRKWTRRHEFKSWTKLIAFHIALIPLGKVWIQLFSLQLWVNSRADWVLQPWWSLGERKLWIQTSKTPLKIDLVTYPARVNRINQHLCTGWMWDKVNFNQIIISLNSKFSFSYISYLTRAKGANCRRENNWIHTFPKSISALWGFELVMQCLFPSTITFTLHHISCMCEQVWVRTRVCMFVYACM